MPYKDKGRVRQYQREWVRQKRTKGSTGISSAGMGSTLEGSTNKGSTREGSTPIGVGSTEGSTEVMPLIPALPFIDPELLKRFQDKYSQVKS